MVSDHRLDEEKYEFSSAHRGTEVQEMVLFMADLVCIELA